jgi:cell wall-associated NlpC family hydrolase
MLSEFVKTAIGVPFQDQGRSREGWDCWGLVVAAYREVWGINLPDMHYQSALDSSQVATLTEVRHQDCWQSIRLGHEQPGDVALFYVGSWPCHVGLVVARGRMLHVSPDFQTRVESYKNGYWRRRLEGIYRYAGLGAR